MNITARASHFIPALVLTFTMWAPKPVNDQAQNSEFMLAFPRVEVNVARDGVLSVGGISTSMLESMTGGLYTAHRLPQGWVDYFVSTDTQHIELMQKDDGLYVWINGRRLPNIAYDKDALQNLTQVAKRSEAFEAAGLDPRTARTIRDLIPMMQRVGLNVLIRFPKRDGADTSEARSVRLRTLPASSAPKQQVSARVRIVLVYDEKGDAKIYGLSEQDLRDVLNVDVTAFALEPWFVEDLMKRNVQHIMLRSEGDGLSTAVNGNALPAMQCDMACLLNLGETISVLNTYEEYAYLNEPLKSFAPYLHGVDAEFVLRFPVAPGEKPVVIENSN